LGEEIFCSFDIYNLLKQGEVLTINDTNAVLLEFNYTAPTDIADYCYNLKKMGYIPVIAHVERYEYLSIDDVVYIKDNGGLIQINASSFFENKYKKKAIDYIKYGLADFVSSDAHFNRAVYLAKAYDFVCKKFNKKIADILFKLNAEKYFNL
jgi:protein-tyrosine phosphatase